MTLYSAYTRTLTFENGGRGISRPLTQKKTNVLYIVTLYRKYARALTFETGPEVSAVHKEVSAVHKNVSSLLAQAQVLKSPLRTLTL